MASGFERIESSAFELALKVDAEKVRRHVASLQSVHPNADRRELARRLIARSRLWAAGSGLLSGLPSNPLIAAPASLADTAALLRIEVKLAAHIALLYDPAFLNSPDAVYELLPPIFGIDKSRAAMRDAGMNELTKLSRARLKSVLGRNGLGLLRDAMLKLFGLQVLQRGAVSKMLPLAGGLIGAAFNWREVAAAGRRVAAWFEESAARRTEDAEP